MYGLGLSEISHLSGMEQSLVIYWVARGQSFPPVIRFVE